MDTVPTGPRGFWGLLPPCQRRCFLVGGMLPFTSNAFGLRERLLWVLGAVALLTTMLSRRRCSSILVDRFRSSRMDIGPTGPRGFWGLPPCQRRCFLVGGMLPFTSNAFGLRERLLWVLGVIALYDDAFWLEVCFHPRLWE
jgi:hypothetical protein